LRAFRIARGFFCGIFSMAGEGKPATEKGSDIAMSTGYGVSGGKLTGIIFSCQTLLLSTELRKCFSLISIPLMRADNLWERIIPVTFSAVN